jgi:hypothetical protein
MGGGRPVPLLYKTRLAFSHCRTFAFTSAGLRPKLGANLVVYSAQPLGQEIHPVSCLSSSLYFSLHPPK